MSTLSSRRNVLRMLGLAGGTAFLAPLALRGGSVAHAVTTPGSVRAYSAGEAALEVDGMRIPLLSAEGGNAFAEYALDPPGPDLIQRKHITNVKFEDIVIQVPVGAAKGLASWIGATLGKGPQAKSGAIVYSDLQFNETKRLEFVNTVLTDITLPACDAATRDQAALTLRLSPESARLSGPKGNGSKPTVKGRTAMATTNAFRLNIQGLENACRSIMKVSALSARRPVVPDAAVRQATKQFAALECSMLNITLAERDAGPFFSWFGEVTQQGNAAERPGRLEFLATDGATVVAVADVGNLGIVRYAPTAFASAAESVQSVLVEMYCETLSLTL